MNTSNTVPPAWAAHLGATQDLTATSKHLTTLATGLRRFQGLLTSADGAAFYRTIATPLKALISPDEIPLPSWFCVRI